MDIPLGSGAKISVTRYRSARGKNSVLLGAEPDVWIGTVGEAVRSRKFANASGALDIVASVVAGRLAGSLVFEDDGNIYARA